MTRILTRDNPKRDKARLWYHEGNHDLFDIAEKLGVTDRQVRRYLEELPQKAKESSLPKKDVQTKIDRKKDVTPPGNAMQSLAPITSESFTLNDVESYTAYCLKHPEIPFNSALIQTAIKLKETQDKLKTESQEEEKILQTLKNKPSSELISLMLSEKNSHDESYDMMNSIEQFSVTSDTKKIPGSLYNK